MTLDKFTATQKFEIIKPRWKDRVVLLADYKIGLHNEIEYRYAPSLPGKWYISGEEAKKWPKCTQNLGFECMHLIGQNKHSKFTRNTLRILPVTINDLRSAVLTNLLGDIFLSFLPHLSLEEGI